MADKPPPEEYSPEETSRRLDLALKRSLAMPPKARQPTQKPKPKGAASGR